MNRTSLTRLVLSALFAALIVAGSYLAIPFTPPVVLANFFVLLAGLLLGPWHGGLAVLLYLALGSMGLPVFAGGMGGLAHFASPTGGFLLGYLASAVVAGAVAQGFTGQGGPTGQTQPGILRLALAGAAGLGVLYAIGLPWFQHALAAKFPTLGAAFLVMIPYLIGDGVKVVAAVVLARNLRRLIP